MFAHICLFLLSRITIIFVFKYFRKSLLMNDAKWLQSTTEYMLNTTEYWEMVVWIEINFRFQSSNQFLAMRHGKPQWVGPQPSYASLSYFVLKCLCGVKRQREQLGFFTVKENNHSFDFPLALLTYMVTWQGIYLRAQNLPFLSSSPVFLLPWLL